MGAIRTTPQVDQNGQQSGQVSIEITYGGKESPFGGIDTSKNAAYIDPNCFASVDGFVVVDDQLVLTSLIPFTIPALFNGASATLLKMGNFYTSNRATINYALGVRVLTSGINPNTLTYIFYLTAWNSLGVIIGDDTLAVQLQPGVIPAIAASFTIPVVKGQPATFTDSGNLAIAGANNGIATASASFGYTAGATIASVVTGLVAAINAVPAFLYSAAPSPDGFSIVLTALTPGAAGNLLGAADNSINVTTPAHTPPYYLGISNGIGGGYTNLIGGADAITINPPNSFNTTPSVAAVGGTLYIANLGPIILKYSGPGTLAISSMYTGVQILRKFAGSLIGLRPISQLGTVLQNRDMIYAWTAANNLDEWSPVKSDGNVTGAGFTQVDDIDDSLSGLIVSNNTAYIIRAKGVSYATALGSGSLPFSFQHISLGDEGEGSQQIHYVNQYDYTGTYVGSSDIFKISNGIASIGEKINSAFFSVLNTSVGPRDSNICAPLIGKRISPLLFLLLEQTLYVYNVNNNTWSICSFTNPPFISLLSVMTETLSFAASVNAIERQAVPCLIFYGQVTSSPATFQTLVFSFVEGTNASNTISNTSQVTFPQEELLFGREVTINSIYMSMNASSAFLTGSTMLTFYINGVVFANYTLDPAMWNTLDGNPIEFQVYPTTVSVFTAKSPQLKIVVNNTRIAAIRFSKIQMYASFDPNQRPVS